MNLCYGCGKSLHFPLPNFIVETKPKVAVIICQDCYNRFQEGFPLEPIAIEPIESRFEILDL